MEQRGNHVYRCRRRGNVAQQCHWTPPGHQLGTRTTLRSWKPAAEAGETGPDRAFHSPCQSPPPGCSCRLNLWESPANGRAVQKDCVLPRATWNRSLSTPRGWVELEGGPPLAQGCRGAMSPGPALLGPWLVAQGGGLDLQLFEASWISARPPIPSGGCWQTLLRAPTRALSKHSSHPSQFPASP